MAAHGLAVGSIASVKTNGIGAARFGKAARYSQSAETTRLGKDAEFTRK
jgi:hypothetical protein